MLLPVLVGAALLAVTATTAWTAFGDEHAYWMAAQHLIAGRPLYDQTAPIWTPYAYWYPPPLAQVLAPLTLVLPDWAFSVLWLGLLLGCLWFLSGRRFFVAIALVAFVPVALELGVRNVHLLIASSWSWHSVAPGSSGFQQPPSSSPRAWASCTCSPRAGAERRCS